MTAPLYSPAILRLATSIPFQTRLAAPMASVEKRSVPCGSWIAVDLKVDSAGRVRAVGLAIRACAFGQASCALLGTEIIGRDAQELASTHDALARWLKGEGALPPWPGVSVLEPALRATARHGAIRLPFEAAAQAARDAAARLAA